MTQPEALRIADMLEAGNNKHLSRAAAELDRLYELALDRQGKLYQLEWASSQEKKTAEQAAAELRRLHELAMDQQGKIYALEMARSMEQKTAKLKRDAELRRLHEENQRCRDVCAATAEGWRVERDALLEALKDIDKEFRKHGRQHWPEAVKARVAIAKAEETA